MVPHIQLLNYHHLTQYTSNMAWPNLRHGESARTTQHWTESHRSSLHQGETFTPNSTDWADTTGSISLTSLQGSTWFTSWYSCNHSLHSILKAGASSPKIECPSASLDHHQLSTLSLWRTWETYYLGLEWNPSSTPLEWWEMSLGTWCQQTAPHHVWLKTDITVRSKVHSLPTGIHRLEIHII